MIRTYLINKSELENINWPENILSDIRKEKIEKLKRDEDRQLSVCVELLLIYALMKEHAGLNFPLAIEEDDRHKLRLKDQPWYFNMSHARDYAVCSLSDAPIGVDIEYFRVKDLMNPDRILHPEETELLAFISNPNEKKKYFYECWVAKESYLKNLGIGLIVRPREFLVNKDRLRIRDQEIEPAKGHHTAAYKADTGNAPEGADTTLTDNLSYLQHRYVHVFEPGEVRGTDWKFDAGYRMAVCSMEKDPDNIARLLRAQDISSALEEAEVAGSIIR